MLIVSKTDRVSQKIKWLFSVFLAIMPLLGIYSSLIPGMSLGEVILVCFWLVFIINQRGILDYYGQGILLTFVLYIFVVMLFNFTIGEVDIDILFRTVRFSMYYLTVVFWVRKFFSFKVFYNMVRIVSFSSVAFLGIQYFSFYVLGNPILGFIPGWSFLQNYSTTGIISGYSNVFRPSSFFLEPSQLCEYLLLFLLTTLFFSSNKHKLISIVVTIIGIVLSTSGLGIILGVVILVLYVLKLFKESNFKIQQLVGIMTIILICPLLYFSFSSILGVTFSRLMTFGTQSATFARFNVYSYFLDDSNIVEFIFGHSYGEVVSETIFMPDLSYIIYGAGIVGLIIVLTYFAKCYKGGNNANKATIIVLVIAFFGTDLFRTLIGVLYMLLASYNALLETKRSHVSNKKCFDNTLFLRHQL